jgi:hypothetical protein
LYAFRIDESKRNDLRDLPNKVIEKTNKYEAVSAKSQLPFVVALVFDRMVIDEERVKQTLCTSGFSEVVTKYFKDRDGNVFTKNFVTDGHGGEMELEDRHDEGVFRKDSLSGVLTFWYQSRQYVNTLFFNNPKATILLTTDVFC